MRHKALKKLAYLLPFTLTITDLSAQSNSTVLSWGIIGIAIIFFFLALILVAENLLKMEAGRGEDSQEQDKVSIFPKWSNLMTPKFPDYVGDADVRVFKKGFDIRLEGKADPDQIQEIRAKSYAVQPQEFIGISPIPKVVVSVGDEVKAGDELFFDKKRPEIKYAAPVSGEIAAINRGEKRSIAEIIILADKEIKFKEFEVNGWQSWDIAELTSFMTASGVWPLLNQRPFDIVPDPNDIPVNIFVSTFDTAPLAPDSNIVIRGQREAFQTGIDVLNKLTNGAVHLGLSANGATAPGHIFVNAENCKKHYFRGPHPSGNVGVHIHHVAPIKGTDKVWTIELQDLLILGRLFNTGKYNTEKTITIAGVPFERPSYVKTNQGANIADLVADNLKEGNFRIISGDVLTGKTVNKDSFLGFSHDQITSLEEGDEYEMFGWLLPIKMRPSTSGTFPNFLFPDIEYNANTNTHGERRAFVETGKYEKLLPMDIYPQHLMKAIMANDIEQMEGLGINELSEEDIALCEFSCTSKMPLQEILREGLDAMREQG